MEAKESRRKWLKEETLAFLDAYGSRQEEFKHPVRKKNRNDFCVGRPNQQGSFDANNKRGNAECEAEELRVYKSSRDNAGQTGAARIAVPFGNELEELFGSRPTIANKHCLGLSGDPIASLPTTSALVAEADENIEAMKFEAIEVQPSSSNCVINSNAVQINKQRMTKNKYLELKLQIMRNYSQEKAQHRKASEQSKQNCHAEKMQLLN